MMGCVCVCVCVCVVVLISNVLTNRHPLCYLKQLSHCGRACITFFHSKNAEAAPCNARSYFNTDFVVVLVTFLCLNAALIHCNIVCFLCFVTASCIV